MKAFPRLPLVTPLLGASSMFISVRTPANRRVGIWGGIPAEVLGEYKVERGVLLVRGWQVSAKVKAVECNFSANRACLLFGARVGADACTAASPSRDLVMLLWGHSDKLVNFFVGLLIRDFWGFFMKFVSVLQLIF